MPECCQTSIGTRCASSAAAPCCAARVYRGNSAHGTLAAGSVPAEIVIERDDRYGRGYETEEQAGSKAGRFRGEYAARSQAGRAARSVGPEDKKMAGGVSAPSWASDRQGACYTASESSDLRQKRIYQHDS